MMYNELAWRVHTPRKYNNVIGICIAITLEPCRFKLLQGSYITL